MKRALALLAAVLASQWVMLTWPFLSTEDIPHALGNPGIRDWWNLRYLFSPSYFEVFWEGSYHPLYTFIAFINHALFGAEPFGFRLFKIALLWGNAVLLVRASRKELGAWAWAAGLFYALQPYHANTAMLDVKDELVALCCLLGLLAHRHAGQRGHPATHVFAIGALNSLALASKETGVVFPALLLAMDYAQQSIPRRDSPDRNGWARSYLVCGAVTLLYAVFRFGVLGAGRGVSLGYSSADPFSAILSRLQGYAAALTGLPWLSGSLLIFPVFAALAGIILWQASPGGRRFALGSLAWLVLGMLPVSGLLPISSLSQHLGSVEFGVALRYLILPGIGYAWLLGLGLRETVGTERWTWAWLPSAFVLFGLLGALSEQSRRLSYPRSDCTVQEGKLAPGNRCVAGLTQINISLPLMRAHFPKAYAHYRGMMDALLGERAPVIADYFSGMLAEPCRTAHFLRRSGTGDFEQVWTGIKEDQASGDSPPCGPWTWSQ